MKGNNAVPEQLVNEVDRLRRVLEHSKKETEAARQAANNMSNNVVALGEKFMLLEDKYLVVVSALERMEKERNDERVSHVESRRELSLALANLSERTMERDDARDLYTETESKRADESREHERELRVMRQALENLLVWAEWHKARRARHPMMNEPNTGAISAARAVLKGGE